MVLSPYGRRHRWHRTLTFIALGLSAAIPIAHVVALKGLTHAREKVSLDLVVASGVCYIVGAVM
jgi:adiponectin receptor